MPVESTDVETTQDEKCFYMEVHDIYSPDV